ncbi:hypothetical protein FAM09_12430 [Niastella caeni]|uniref:Protein kinase domain-containing protein n=1 Tax=Niastella caeni TaxID=2569763 RepID=A0A4S8HUM8_9BACT|nr:lanthionine synthetase LanC family protein [Niastella caeni]THU39313.1 hypothetical protein FAM09_12430 [Niastella caeni]
MKPAITESITQSLTESESKGKVEKKAGKRVGYNYIIVKSYKESQKNDVVKCLYIKSLADFGFCVIKEGSYGDTKDKHGRDIIDRLKWQKQLHEQLQDKLPIPKLLGYFEERGNYYLVIELIKGKSLYKVCSEKRKELRQSIIQGGKLGMRFLDYLIQIAGILETLHSQQIVHRDATPNNYMISSDGKVTLIDMEMCYSVKTKFPTPAFALGTYGYMSKQQEAISTPTTAEDIFALGAIMLHIWSGVSPGKLTNEPIAELTQKITFFIPDQQVAHLVTQCLLPEDDLRPNATKILEVLKQYKTDLKRNVSRPVNQPLSFSREQILATIKEGIATLATPLLADEEKGWFSDDMKPASNDDKHKLRKVWYASYSHGVSGVIYLLALAKRIGLDTDITLPFVQKGLDLIKLKYIDRINQAKAGLHFGSDGIAAVLSTAIRERLIEPSDHFEWIDLLLQKASQQENIVSGLAGQGLSNLACKSFLSSEHLIQRLQNYAYLLISKQEPDGSWVNGYYRQKFTKRKRKKVTKGFADGLAGIICFLLEYGYWYKHAESINAAQQGLRWLIKKAHHKNGNIHWLTSKDKDLNYDLSNGIAGIALCFIRAYQYTGELIYRKYAEMALYGIPADIIDGNIGQRKGLSGLGEVYLEAYKVFKTEEWLERANWIAQIILQLKKQHPKYGTYWLVESERQPVANFMAGNSGVLHFLLRYYYTDKIGFPLMPEL